MKRIIFSLYNNDVKQESSSVTDYKKSQFEIYKEPLIDSKKYYADQCHADFVLHEIDINNFVDIQFEKIRLLESYADEYDEILYLDLDVVPRRQARPIFDYADTSKLCMHPLVRELRPYELRSALRLDALDSQNMFVKTCSKNSMLLLEGINGNNKCYNTGVVLGNSEIIKSIRFTEQLDEMVELVEEAREDNVFPEQVSRHFVPNNEVFISYLVERDNIPHVDLTMNWNFIMDGIGPRKVDEQGELIHWVTKEFEYAFGEL